jgi:hypothetical protein
VSGLRGDAKRLRELITASAGYPTARQRVEAIHDYFDRLDPDDARRLTLTEPDLVGNLDGAPFATRFEANRLCMTRDRDVLGRRIADGSARTGDYVRHATLDRMLESRPPGIDPGTGLARSTSLERNFAVYRKGSARRSVRAVEVLGDLTTASQVLVSVPGFGNKFDRFESLVAGVNRVRDAAGPDETAGIVWLGYDTPQADDLLGVLGTDRAMVGGKRLNEFSAALNREITPGARTTLLAHSYGSVVAGEALRHGAEFDNVIVAGSPGMGSEVTSVESLGVAKERFFVLRANGDFVTFSQWHGRDPAEFPDARRLDTGDVRGHPTLTSYLRPDSEALANIVRVVRSDYDGLRNKIGEKPWWADAVAFGADVVRGVRDFVEDHVLDRFEPGDDRFEAGDDRLEPSDVRPHVPYQPADRLAPSEVRSPAEVRADPMARAAAPATRAEGGETPSPDGRRA